MKKVLFFAASAIALFASCQKTEVNYVGEPQEIAFFAVNKTATKAPVDGVTFPDDNMQVAAYLASGGTATGNFFNQTEFTKQTQNGQTVWTGSRYWPVTGAIVNFLAVSEPATANQTLVSTQFGTTNFAETATVELGDNSTALYDLMYAVGQGTCAPANYPTVDMQFRHALTWLKFQAKATQGAVKINSIKLNNIAVAGKLTVDNSANYNKADLVTTADATVRASWTNTSDGEFTIYGSTNLTQSLTTEYSDCGNLLVIPELDVQVRTCTINYTLTNGTTQTTYNQTFEINTTLDMAKRYLYQITFNVNEITITPIVKDWTEAESTPQL